jgi:hypothetical protein
LLVRLKDIKINFIYKELSIRLKKIDV